MDRTVYLRRIKQHLQTAYLLSEEKTESMLPIFFATLREHMNRLAHLAADGDMEQLAKASHAVKGALLNIGLMDLAETAHTLETQSKNGNHAFDYRALIAELQYTLTRFDDGI